jgi:hypothetical protein
MYLTTTGTCIATLTRFGRQVAAENSVNFKITQYRLSDDEIDYSLFDATPNSAQTDILNTPILEACTIGGLASQKYFLESFPKETQQVAYLDTNIEFPFIDGEQNKRTQPNKIVNVILDVNSYSSNMYTFKVRTFYGADSNYIVQSLMPTIIIPVNSNYASIPCTDQFENRQNQTETTIQLTWNISDNTPVSVNSELIENISPKTIDIIKFITGQSITSSNQAQQKEMLLSTGQLIKRGGPINWGIIGAASCRVHLAGVTTQKGYDIEFLLYDGLKLSQREAVPVQPATSDTDSTTISTTTSSTTTSITSKSDVTLTYVNGVAGHWVDNPEWVKLNQLIINIQNHKASGVAVLFGNVFMKQYQEKLRNIPRYVFVPLS